jgi:hypothetical protein
MAIYEDLALGEIWSAGALDNFSTRGVCHFETVCVGQGVFDGHYIDFGDRRKFFFQLLNTFKVIRYI